ALTKRGVWDILFRTKRLVLVGSVRQALDATVSGNADAAIVFATDARADQELVRVDAMATPGRDHDPIRYVAAVTQQAQDKNASRLFIAYLKGRSARSILAEAGFGKAE
ncbi:MAG: molybdate ABC transporter substrate-binding protein, partial [Armatimonadota bacterium]